MVRDGAHFYRNLGIFAEGCSIDFQGTANAYLRIQKERQNG